MLKALPYLAVFIVVGALVFSAYKWGYNVARLEQAESTNQALAISAKHIIDEQAKLQIIEDVINKDDDKTVIKSPVLMRTLVRLHDCEGKTKC